MFETILGNKSVKAYLNKRVEMGFLSNTLLFSGKAGVGKSLFALELANKLLDSNKKQHPDLFTFHPDGKALMHSIESIRYLRDEVYKPPFEANAKVFIIFDADKMLSSASNALLKTLEEPTLDSYIILLTSNEDNLLPTILSRCSKVSFFPLPEEDVYRFMVDKWNISDAEAKTVARLSEGSLENAYMLSQHEGFQKKSELVFSLLQSEVIDNKALDQIQALVEKEKKQSGLWKKEIELLFTQILNWHHDIYFSSNEDTLFYPQYASILKNKRKVPLFKIEEVLDKAYLGVERNIRFSTCLEALLLELS